MDSASGNDRAKIALLMDCYGKMLTEKQFTAMDLYFQEDFTLSEISEQTGITRQGVWDNIKRGERLLVEMETKLHLVDRLNKIKEKITAASAAAENLREYAGEKFLPSEMINDLDIMIDSFREILE